MDSLVSLGIDAIWFSPFFKSPQKDAGYDISDYLSIDPIFGTNEDLDELLAKAKTLGIRIIVDIVPNHTSDQHAWFQRAINAPEGSAERDFYLFRDGKGANGELPPNNWQSIFGGPAWTRTVSADGTPGQWFLHMFDSTQPDLNWDNPKVADEFDEILRFWLKKGVDGFRVDVAHGLVKRAGLPDATIYDENLRERPIADYSLAEVEAAAPYWGQPGVHDAIRLFRCVLDEFDDRAF
jgi:alpha-glucosidase